MNESVGNVMYMKYLMDMPVSGGMTFNDEDNNLINSCSKECENNIDRNQNYNY